jgi:flagellar assembly protein FliH
MSRLIRHDAPTATASFRFHDYEREARAVLDSARDQAERLIADAHRQVAQLLSAQRRDGHAEGLELGRREGREQVLRDARQAGLSAAVEAAKADVAQIERALRTALTDFERQKRSLIASAESGLIELALAIARRVCKSVAAATSHVAAENVRAVLEMVQNAHDVTIRLHPEDFARLAEIGQTLIADVSQHQHVNLAADPNVDRGGCILASSAGIIDARIETQLDRIAAALCQTDGAGTTS